MAAYWSCYGCTVARVIQTPIGSAPYVPWQDYADGQTWELRQGEDFRQDAEHARAAVRAWARRRGLVVRTSVPAPDRLRVQVVSGQGLRGSP